MDLDALRMVIDVLERGSFAAAARERGVEPSSISRLVANLEAELGFRLFQRTTRHLSPTEAGAAYLARAGPLLEDLDAARDEARFASAGPSGTLRLTASVAFGTRRILPLIPAFRVAYPAVQLELVFTDSNLDLVAERIDLAVRLAPQVSGDLVCTRLMPTRYRVCAAASYWEAHSPVSHPTDIKRHRCLLFALPTYRKSWLFRAEGQAALEVPVAGDIVVSNALALYEATRMGLGPALLPDWLIADDLAAGLLVDGFPGFEAAATSFDTAAWLLYPSRAFLPNKVRVAIDFLRAHWQAI